MLASPRNLLFLLSLSLARCDVAELRPSEEVSRQRGPQIFNAVHDSMRQWGSSLHHNGMSFFLATVPRGVLLYHGNTSPESPSEPDWLAYEIEHAEQFAHPFRRRPPGGPPGGRPGEPPRGPPGGPPPEFASEHQDMEEQHVIGDGELKRSEKEGGWLHVYRATEPLKLLYVDGMGGGKTSMGTLDTQDRLLRGLRSVPVSKKKPLKALGGGPMGERERANELCELAEAWGLHGILRMEAGFEIIMCDFTNDLEEIQALRRADRNAPVERDSGIRRLEGLRGFAERYQGIGASRTLVDYSSMVSAFFFPVNLTNPDERRRDLPRLVNVSDFELDVIKKYIRETVDSRRDADLAPINWQGISDLIVGRYADRIEFMANSKSLGVLVDELDFLLDVFIHYPENGEKPDLTEAALRCADFYLQSITPSTEADKYIHAAFQALTSEICSTLFEVRGRLSSSMKVTDSDLESSTDELRSLLRYLGWSRFKRCSGCDLSEVCFIPMWPMGSVEDYEHPSCKNGSGHHGGDSYWKMR